jgi:hypothetical protein
MTNRYAPANDAHFPAKLSFLLLSLPLGIFYFLTVFIGLTLSTATLIIGIGFLLLERTCALVHVLGDWERQQVARFLRMDLPRARRSSPNQTWRQRLRSSLSDSLTWKRCVYLLLKFPLGLLSFGLTVPLLVVSAGLTLMPLIYLLGTYFLGTLLPGNIPAILLNPDSIIQFTGSFDGTMFARSLVAMGGGIVCSLLTFLLINGLVALCAVLARALLIATPEKDDEEGSQLYRMSDSTLPLDMI